MRKRTLTIAIALVCMLVLIGGSVAYFTTENTATNAVSSSNVKIELVLMEMNDSEEMVLVSGEKTVVPGEGVMRTASIKNTGSEDAWVRIKIPKPENIELWQETDPDKWTEKEDCLYYNTPLKPGETTDPLYFGVNFDESLGNNDSGKKLSLLLKGQGVQHVHNGEVVTDAQGWPEE